MYRNGFSSISPWYRFPLCLLKVPSLLASLMILAACAGGITLQDQSITVAGSHEGTDGTFQPVAPVVSTVTHVPGEQLPRVHYSRHGMQNVQTVRLEATESTGLPLEEEFVFLSISRPAEQPGSAVTPILERTDVPGWIRAHIGDLAVLRIRKDDISLPQSDFSQFSAAALRPLGANWLARVEDDDRFLPWRRNVDETACFPIPMQQTFVRPPDGQGEDCFDMETLTAMLLSQFAAAVSEGVVDADIPLIGLSATQHRMYVVPHLQAGFADAPGFGFIYAVDVGVTLGVGIAQATVYAPVSIHFRRNPPGPMPDFEIGIDPLGAPPPNAPWLNIPRITVMYEQGPINEVVAGQIRGVVVNALEEFTPPLIQAGGIETDLEEALNFIFAVTMPRSSTSRPPVDHNVIALPEQRVTVDGTISPLAMSIPMVTVTEGVNPLAPASPDPETNLTGTLTVTTDASGFVTLNRVLDPLGQLSRVIRLAPITTHNRFALYMLE
ncbi:MAG: hypothetical protein JJT90_17265 [Ectothiorhodospiraceae bacterium]|nr:hypothetical protein [Ectothiorhodospiraceae bacterium]